MLLIVMFLSWWVSFGHRLVDGDRRLGHQVHRPPGYPTPTEFERQWPKERSAECDRRLKWQNAPAIPEHPSFHG
jgi:hypothetical protein